MHQLSSFLLAVLLYTGMFQTLGKQIMLTLESKKKKKGNFQTFYLSAILEKNLRIILNHNLNIGENSRVIRRG